MAPLHQIGRVSLGIALAGFGLMQLVNGELIRLVPKLPAWVPAPGAWPVVIGVLLLGIGAAIIANRKTAAAAILLAVLLFASFVVQRIPEILANPGAGFVWTNPAKVLALMGGALLLAGGARMALVAAATLGIFLLVCGAQHFVYAGFVDGLVPAWIPPGRRFWTILTAVALLAGGLGVILPWTRRIAGFGAGVMIFLWVPLVHVVRTWETRTAFELAGVFEALALVGVAWLVAAAPGELDAKARRSGGFAAVNR